MPRPAKKNSGVLPVFFDPSRQRWVAIKSLSSFALVSLLALLSVLLVSILNGPQLERFSLSSPESRFVTRQPDIPTPVPPTDPTVGDSASADDIAFFLEEPVAGTMMPAAGSTH